MQTTGRTCRALWAGYQRLPDGKRIRAPSSSTTLRPLKVSQSLDAYNFNSPRHGKLVPLRGPQPNHPAARAALPMRFMESGAASTPAKPLWEAVLHRYAAAQQAGAAYQTETDTQALIDSQYGLRFILRVAAALRDKPKPPKASGDKKEWRNPFLPYEPDLWVQHLSETHTLLLNKFNVVAHHLLVVTRDFQSQLDPLNARDFAATLQVLQSMPQGGMAYYNCGSDSGASQPHKHLQIVPLPFEEGGSADPPFGQLVEEAWTAAQGSGLQAVAMRQLPFRSYCTLLPGRVTGEQLEKAFQGLHEAATSGLEASVSYNVLLTLRFMMVVPRRSECCGPVAVNSLGYAGTLLVRSKEELEFIHKKGPIAILTEVGQPW
ncbi:hypothetical protein WJX72_008674 [[Myrmecia] bisecta]|uniref:ATP adenylyltransferase n=1 Tax=[Myrmecia] bisecta TaxID=41462 RepID=A0AAW1PAP0_9CHLO